MNLGKYLNEDRRYFNDDEMDELEQEAVQEKEYVWRVTVHMKNAESFWYQFTDQAAAVAYIADVAALAPSSWVMDSNGLGGYQRECVSHILTRTYTQRKDS